MTNWNEPTLADIAARMDQWAQSGLRVLDQIPQYLPVTVKAVTTAYQVTGFDRVITADATGGAFTVTLPSAVGRHGQQAITVKRVNGGGNAVTIASGGGTIDGATTQSLASQWAMMSFASDGKNWIRVS